MRIQNLFSCTISLAILLGFFIPGQAVQVPKSTTEDFQNWDAVYLNKPLTSKLTVTLETQNRLQNDWNNESTLFLRPSLTYKLTPRLSVTGGYSWDPNFTVHEPRFHNEQRLWEQVMYTHSLTHDFKLALRTRMEERFISGSGHAGWRGRQMVKVTHPIPFLDKKKYYITAYDELFVNMNSVNSSTIAGIDQNRDFVGIGTHLSKDIILETGYMLDYNHKVYTPNKLIQALVFSLTYTMGEPLFKKHTESPDEKKLNFQVSKPTSKLVLVTRTFLHRHHS